MKRLGTKCDGAANTARSSRASNNFASLTETDPGETADIGSCAGVDRAIAVVQHASGPGHRSSEIEVMDRMPVKLFQSDLRNRWGRATILAATLWGC